jgi:hypothetical protein
MAKSEEKRLKRERTFIAVVVELLNAAGSAGK